ncbi:hypothetical protein IEQ34_015849 [Dendrobium chrysotoxum]|uniref:Uncharacterized protein n=1 Tax=Dendrobium chrysotoxum TaxID=161865 RepID=A0AAV7GHW7_DENCH|nr:hypothetical protein IEQ34_015849 [Dendrobium chrysotoxum]
MMRHFLMRALMWKRKYFGTNDLKGFNSISPLFLKLWITSLCIYRVKRGLQKSNSMLNRLIKVKEFIIVPSGIDSRKIGVDHGQKEAIRKLPQTKPKMDDGGGLLKVITQKSYQVRNDESQEEKFLMIEIIRKFIHVLSLKDHSFVGLLDHKLARI